MENLTNEEKDYYELLVDLLENGEISDSERNILNKRKEKYSISDSRAIEIEEFAKQERLKNLKPQNDSENSYYELILDFMENGIVSESNRKILNKRLEKYGITEARAKELEYFAKQEYLESKKVKFESEEEKEYYEFIVDLMENGAISENSRKILDKRKIKFGISETRAKELEEFAKQNNSASSNDLLEEGKTYCNNGEYDKAIEIFKKAIELNPNDDESCRWLGNSYLKNNQIEEAIKSHLKATELNSNDYQSWLDLAISYIHNEQYEEAIEPLLKAIELNPNDASSLSILGYVYKINGQYEEAINSLLKAIELNPNDDYSWQLLGECYCNNGELDNAINSCLKATQLNPDNSENWYWLGRSYNDNQQHQEAIDSLIKATQLVPDSPEYWYRLCISYHINGQYQDAINSGLKATQLNPDYAGNWAWLGSSYGMNGQYQEAKIAVSKALEIDPNYEFAKKLQSFLSSNEGVSLDGVVSGISKGIDTLNELSGKINPSTIGMVVGAAKLVGKFFGGSNKDKN